jgi:hypothetical protein
MASNARFVRTTNGVTFIGAGLAATPEIEAGHLVALDLAHPLCKSAQVRLIARAGEGRCPSPQASC